MLDSEGSEIVAALARLASLIGRDPALRDGLRALARVVLDATAEEPAASSQATEPVVDSPPIAVVPPEPQTASVAGQPAPRLESGPLPALTLGQLTHRSSSPELPAGVALDRMGEPALVPLETIAARCRLKAEASRWAARPPAWGADRNSEVNALIDRARGLSGCYLWMVQPHVTLPAEHPEVAEQMAEAYETVADTAEMLRLWLAGPARDEALSRSILLYAAEAQSALRVTIEALGGRKDTDQVVVYSLLRDEGASRRIFIDRYMKLADPADPSRLRELRSSIAETVAKLGSSSTGDRNRRSRFKQIAYHARRIREGTGSDHDWRKIAETADDAVRDGTPPSASEFRENLVPIFDERPTLDHLPNNVRLVFREIDSYLENLRDPDELDQARPDREPTPEVQEVAKALRGRKVVFIGGVPRPHNRKMLREAFNLAELDWLVTRDHQSIESFEHNIARPEVALVILAIRWSNHSFAGAKEFCDRHGKPMVRLKAGYGPNQVALQIVAQCSEQLGISHVSNA